MSGKWAGRKVTCAGGAVSASRKPESLSGECERTIPYPLDGAKQAIKGPPNADAQPAWLDALKSWRTSCRQSMGLHADESPGKALFDMEALKWTQNSFVHTQSEFMKRMLTAEGHESMHRAPY